jgi:hypothetical protein
MKGFEMALERENSLGRSVFEEVEEGGSRQQHFAPRTTVSPRVLARVWLVAWIVELLPIGTGYWKRQ